MGRILYFISIILIIFWSIGFFFYSIGAIIHVFLLLALIVIVVRYQIRRSIAKTRSGRDVSKSYR